MRKPKLLAIDTETTGLNPWRGCRPFSMSTCDDEGNQTYFEWKVNPYDRSVTYHLTPKLIEVLEWIADPTVTTVFFNAKFDVRQLDFCDLPFDLQGPMEEVMFAAHACNSHEPSFKLKDLSYRYFRINRDDEKALDDAVKEARRIANRWNEQFITPEIVPYFKGGRRGMLSEYRKQGGDFSEFPQRILIGGNAAEDKWLPRYIIENLPQNWWGKLKEEDKWLNRTYCKKDTERTMLLWMMYDKQMDQLGVRDTYNMEMQLWPIVKEMEERGIRLDVPLAHKMRKQYATRATKYAHRCYAIAGKVLNLNSPDQVREVVYTEMGETVKHTTGTGKASVGLNVLEDLRDTNAFVKALSIYRTSAKAVSSFYDNYLESALPDPLVPGGHVIHADFNQVGPRTGRFSCRNPNLQQAAEASTGRSILPVVARRAFGPRPGYIWYAYDYSQLEVRIFADLSQEEIMLEAIKHDRDLHAECANKAWGGHGNPAAIRAAIHTLEVDADRPEVDSVLPWWEEGQRLLKKAGIPGEPSAKRTNEQSKTRMRIFEAIATEWLNEFDWDIVKAEKTVGKKVYRNRAKLVLFSKLFGGGAGPVAEITKVSIEEARGFIRDYDRAFPRIRGYIQDASNMALEYGYIRTAFGRMLRVDPDRSYCATNYSVQGSAADMMKRGMIKVAHYLKSLGIDAHILMTIHDEIMIEIRKDHVEPETLMRIQALMEDHGGAFSIPMPVNIEEVPRFWDRKLKVEDFAL